MELDLEEMMVNMTDAELREMEAMFMDHGDYIIAVHLIDRYDGDTAHDWSTEPAATTAATYQQNVHALFCSLILTSKTRLRSQHHWLQLLTTKNL